MKHALMFLAALVASGLAHAGSDPQIDLSTPLSARVVSALKSRGTERTANIACPEPMIGHSGDVVHCEIFAKQLSGDEANLLFDALEGENCTRANASLRFNQEGSVKCAKPEGATSASCDVANYFGAFKCGFN